MNKTTMDKILKNSGLIQEAGLDFGRDSKKENDLDLSFETPEASSSTEKHKDSEETNKNSDSKKDKTPRQRLHELVLPQVEVAKQMVVSINNAFSNIKTKKYNDMLEQVKNFEKQMRGACQQVIAEAESIHFDTNDKMICSPKAFSIIKEYDSRDRSVLELVAAIIIFSNSLT